MDIENMNIIISTRSIHNIFIIFIWILRIYNIINLACINGLQTRLSIILLWIKINFSYVSWNRNATKRKMKLNSSDLETFFFEWNEDSVEWCEFWSNRNALIIILLCNRKMTSSHYFEKPVPTKKKLLL